MAHAHTNATSWYGAIPHATFPVSWAAHTNSVIATAKGVILYCAKYVSKGEPPVRVRMRSRAAPTVFPGESLSQSGCMCAPRATPAHRNQHLHLQITSHYTKTTPRRRRPPHDTQHEFISFHNIMARRHRNTPATHVAQALTKPAQRKQLLQLRFISLHKNHKGSQLLRVRIISLHRDHKAPKGAHHTSHDTGTRQASPPKPTPAVAFHFNTLGLRGARGHPSHNTGAEELDEHGVSLGPRA